jgi:uncharacterized protein (DUF1501 family)
MRVAIVPAISAAPAADPLARKDRVLSGRRLAAMATGAQNMTTARTTANLGRRQQNLFAEVSPEMKAFCDATVTLGVASQVTTFTLSDFGRTHDR